jgi:hypothetical protein
MVMFKAKFRPDPQWGKPRAQAQQAHQPQPVPPHDTPQQQDDKPPPIEKERGPQYPVKEPGPRHEPERVRGEKPGR